MKIYVASSWRNPYQPGVVNALLDAQHGVYDFREPEPGEHGFSWSGVDPQWRDWTPQQLASALRHPVAVRGFAFDYEGLRWADVCVLVMPCGLSAHMEAAWMAGQGKPVVVYVPPEVTRIEPELMYNLLPAHGTTKLLVFSMAELLEWAKNE